MKHRSASALVAMLLALGLSVPGIVGAANPPAGTVSPQAPVLQWEGASFPLGASLSPEYCAPERPPTAILCDHFTLTADLEPAYWDTRDGGVRITITWDDPADEFNLHVFRGEKLVATSTVHGAGMEQLTIREASGAYEVRVTPVKVTNSGYKGTAELTSQPQTVPTSQNEAFHGVRVSDENPATEPQSSPTSYNGAPLVLQAVDVGRGAGEPTIGIDPSGTAFYAAAAWDCMLPTPGTSGRALTSCPRDRLLRSNDGGLSWEDVSPGLPAGLDDRHPVTFDPFVYVEDQAGRVFFLDLIQLVPGSQLSYTDDQGGTYQTTIAAAPLVNDRPSLASGPVPAGLNLSTLDPDFDELVYYCVFQLLNEECMRSLDGGRTFLPTTPIVDPEKPLCASNRGDVQTDVEGRVFIPHLHCGEGANGITTFDDIPALFISEDAGDTWRLSIVSETVGGVFPLGVQVTADTAGNMYYVWFDNKHLLPYLATSTDHGMTWSDPLMIALPGVREVNFPTIVAGDEGRVAITFIGTTVGNLDDQTRPWNSYVLMSTNALDENPLFVSQTVNPLADPIHRGDCQVLPCAGFRDFLDIQVSPFDGAVWATLVDTCTAIAMCNLAAVAGVDDDTGELNAAKDSRGIAIRQLSGPSLRE